LTNDTPRVAEKASTAGEDIVNLTQVRPAKATPACLNVFK